MLSSTKPPLPPDSLPVNNFPPLPPKQAKGKAILRLSFTILLGILFGMAMFLAWLTYGTTEEQRQKLFSQFQESKNIVQSFTGLQQTTHVLVMGVDLPGTYRDGGDTFKGVRSDTMMLTRLDPIEKTISVISVPRDSRVSISRGHGTDKLNAAFAYGGPELTKETIQDNFGITVDHIFVVNTAGVREVVDALGGIDVRIDKPMHYNDFSAHLYINFQPGEHHLNGSQAEGFLRFRHDPLGDIGRVRRQQVFLSAIMKRLKDPTVWLSIPHVIDVGMRYVLTDLTPADLIAMATFAKSVQPSGFQVGTLPGHPAMVGGGSYWIVNQEDAEKLINRLYLGIVPSPDVEELKRPITVGLLYSKTHTADLAAWQAKIEEAGLTVQCKAPQKQRPTQFIVHNMGKTSANFDQIRHISPAFENVQLIFSPYGSTFETNSCGNTDFTLVLGDNTRSLSNQ